MSMKMGNNKAFADETFLASAEYKARPYTLKSKDVTADANGKKIVKAGTPLPKNDGTVKGLIITDADVTNNDLAVALVFEGEVSTAKLAKNGVTIADTAKAKLPRITFFD